MTAPEAINTLDTLRPPADDGGLPRRPTELSGNGDIGRKTAWAMAILLLLILFLPGLYQTFYDATVLKRFQFADLLVRMPTAQSLNQFEKDLTDQSRLDRWVRHTYWTLAEGTPRAPVARLIGSRGFLFSDEEQRVFNAYSLTDPAPSPASTIMPAILDFKAQLGLKGIRLILLPIPMKISIYPELAAIDYKAADGPPLPPGYANWIAEVRRNGIDVIDLTSTLWNAKGKLSDPVFWTTDTHWSFRGRAIGADAIANHLRPLITGFPSAQFDVGVTQIDLEGDIARGIAVGWGNTKYPHIHDRTIKLTRIAKPFIGDDESPILLLGDSFTVFYDHDGYGLAQELMLRLHTPIQAIGTPAEPINVPRTILAQQPQILVAKKIVVWEFAVRYIWKDWDKVPLK
jgi:hypothetical protein